MPVGAYSSSLNVQPEPAAGNGSMGKAVCNPNNDGFMVATTANRAGGTVDLGGIALEDFTTGGLFRVCTSGYVPADVVGTLTGAGDYVDVDATGSLVRSAAITADTIGKYQSDGAVIVDLFAQSGGGVSGDATSIQGVAVTLASASMGFFLMGDGLSIRPVRERFNFSLIRHPDDGTYPDPTGVTPCNKHLQWAIDNIPRYSDLWINNPSSHFLLDMGTNITVTRPSADLISHPFNDLPTGSPVIFWATGSTPTGIVQGTTYYTIRQGASSSKLATSLANALAGVAIAITTAGVGTIGMFVTDRKPVIGYDDAERGQKSGIRFVGEGPRAHSSGKYHFRHRGKRKQGTAASITARTNGGSGDFHQTITVDPEQGVLASQASRYKGRFIVLYDADDDDNHCDAIIVDVPADNTLRVSNQNTNALGTDLQNGSICWWIDEPCWDLRGKDFQMENLGLGVSAVGYASIRSELGALLELNHPPGSNAQNVIHNHFIGCNFETDSHTSGHVRDLVWIARDILATDASNFCWRGLNGLGELQVCTPSQTDTFRFVGCNFNMGTRSCVAFWSVTGQSKENRFVECQFGAGGIRTSSAVMVPADKKNTTWVAGGNAHWDMHDCSFGHMRDACIQTGGYASAQFRFTQCYSESTTFALRANTNSTHTPILIKDCNWLGGVYPASSRSGLFVSNNGAGPLVIEGGFVDGGPDGHDIHIEVNSAQTTRNAQVSISNFWLHGRSDYKRRAAFRSSNKRGPFNFSGGNFWLRISIDGAADVEAQLTQASFDAACAYSVNLAEVRCEELAEWFNAQAAFAGAGAWGRGDESYFYIRSLNLTGTQSIQVRAGVHGAGTDANDKLGFDLLLDVAGALTQMASDSANLVDVTKSAGSTGYTRLTVKDVCLSTSAGDAAILCNNFGPKDYNFVGPTHFGRNILENIGGISGSNGVQPKNFGGSVNITDPATTGTVAFPVTEDNNSYRIARLSLRDATGLSATFAVKVVNALRTNGFDLELDAAPGGGRTVTVDWGIER